MTIGANTVDAVAPSMGLSIRSALRTAAKNGIEARKLTASNQTAISRPLLVVQRPAFQSAGFQTPHETP